MATLAAWPLWAASGSEVAVSRLPGPQNEPAIAIDPVTPDVLVAGSNSFAEGTMRVYGSTDGGRTWDRGTIYPLPESNLETCAADPGVAIDRSGRQYYSFVRSMPCGTGMPRVYVASRAGPADAWDKPVVAATLGTAALFDDKPAIAVDTSSRSPHVNRLYVAWSRLCRRTNAFGIVLSYSDDGGRTWSKPARVSRTGTDVTYASVAVGPKGTVYVAWDDASNFTIKIARSTDGGARFGPEKRVASFAVVSIPHCRSGIVIPAQRLTCARANPIVSVDTSAGRFSGRVYVSYAQNAFYGNRGVFVSAYSSALGALPNRRLGAGVAVAPPKGGQRSDQFWPASAVDPVSGTVWVCFYDTKGDPRRKRARFSCTTSRNGGTTWSALVPAASVASDETVKEADGREYGDYEGLVARNGVAHPIWTDSRDLAELGEEIYTTRLTGAGSVTPAPVGR